MRVVVLQDVAALRRTLRILNGMPGAVLGSLDRAGELAIRQWRANVKAGRSSFHTFPALAPGYAAAKVRRWGRKPILVASGSMFSGFTWLAKQVGANAYRLDLGASGRGPDGTRNGDKALWAVEGQHGGKRAGRSAKGGEWLLGGKKGGRRKPPVTRSWVRPPRVFTALPGPFLLKVLSDFMRDELSRLHKGTRGV